MMKGWRSFDWSMLTVASLRTAKCTSQGLMEHKKLGFMWEMCERAEGSRWLEERTRLNTATSDPQDLSSSFCHTAHLPSPRFIQASPPGVSRSWIVFALKRTEKSMNWKSALNLNLQWYTVWIAAAETTKTNYCTRTRQSAIHRLHLAYIPSPTPCLESTVRSVVPSDENASTGREYVVVLL